MEFNENFVSTKKLWRSDIMNNNHNVVRLHSKIVVFSFLLSILSICDAAPVKAWGIMIHDDGDLLFEPQQFSYSPTCSANANDNKEVDPRKHLQYIKCRYKGFRQAGIDTLKLNVFSSLTYFDFNREDAPTVSRLDSRAEFLDRASPVAPRIIMARKLFELGPLHDPVATALREFRASGGKTILSFRIADSHYLQVKNNAYQQHPLVSKFFLENQSWVIGAANLPIGVDSRLGKLMDFERKEVRRHFISVVEVALAKYSSLIDGIEIDFTRNPILFRNNVAKKNAYLLDDILRELRGTIKNSSTPDLALFARVPAAPAMAMAAGINIQSWIENNLVDVLVPSELMDVDPDPDIGKMVSLAHKHGVSVFYGMPGRRSATLWRLNSRTMVPDVYLINPAATEKCDESCLGKKLLQYKLPAPDYLLGVAVNARAKGADGVELYNFAAESIRSSPWFANILIPNLKLNVPAHAVSFSSNKKSANAGLAGVGLPIEVNARGFSPFEIFVGNNLLFHGAAQLRVALLNKRGISCEVRALPEATQLTKVRDYQTAFFNLNSGAALQVERALKYPGIFFPEGMLVYSIPAQKIKAGYNRFGIQCAQPNVLMDAELTSVMVDAPEQKIQVEIASQRIR